MPGDDKTAIDDSQLIAISAEDGRDNTLRLVLQGASTFNSPPVIESC